MLIVNDWSNIRNDFPILNQGRRLVYLDSAASAQKPQIVIDSITNFYTHEFANIHRGIYELSENASQAYEKARMSVQQFINAANSCEIIFTSGTTESINIVAQCFGREYWQAGDEVIISGMEHHSNIVPWYLLQQQIGIVLKVIPVHDDGTLDLENYKKLFSTRTKLLAVTHASNVLGTINPIKEMIQVAHEHEVPVLIDGAQAVPHMPVDVQALDCDFYAFSGHKLYGPTGIGILYGKKNLLNQMVPYQGGGGMIEAVNFDRVVFAPIPQKFEAGTSPIAEAIGLQAAIHYVQKIGIGNIYTHEKALLNYAESQLATVSDLRIIGTAKSKLGVISFVIKDIHPHDIGTVLDHENIAIRAGHHCAMPLMERFNVPATVRASLGIYNNENDIECLVQALQLAKRIFG